MKVLPRWSSVPLSRRWISDIVYFGNKTNPVGARWVINIAKVAAARRLRTPAISWIAIWIKAVALASRKWPELRMAYQPFPWPHLYTHPFTVANVVVEREWGGAPATFFDMIPNPETMTLAELETSVRASRQLPVEQVGGFRRLIRVSRWPVIFRRMFWSIALQWSGSLRSSYFGTFCVNNVAVRRAEVVQITTPVSFTFYLGAVGPNGDMVVHVFLDHRLLDGLPTVRMVRTIETILNEDIVAELNAA